MRWETREQVLPTDLLTKRKCCVRTDNNLLTQEVALGVGTFRNMDSKRKSERQNGCSQDLTISCGKHFSPYPTRCPLLPLSSNHICLHSCFARAWRFTKTGFSCPPPHFALVKSVLSCTHLYMKRATNDSFPNRSSIIGTAMVF